MPIDIPELKKKPVGGIYVIKTSEMENKGVFKVGMSVSNIYRRLDSYQLVLPWGYEITMLLLMRNKTKVEKQKIRECEKWIHRQLKPANLTTRIYKDKIEVFENNYYEIYDVLLKAQEKYQTLGFYNNFDEEITYDDKLYEVKKILGEKVDSSGRTQYKILWGDNTTSYEFRSALEGTDHKGPFIVKAFKEYLQKRKKAS